MRCSSKGLGPRTFCKRLVLLGWVALLQAGMSPVWAQAATCQTWGIESDHPPPQGSLLPSWPSHRCTMDKKDGEKWASAADLPLTAPQPDRQPGASASSPVVMARPMAEDPALEARVLALAQELRCLVCQNETIAASHAELAQDLRQQIRVQLQQGQSPEKILDFMVARYGDFVRYRPALQGKTWLLWLGPFLFLFGALGGLFAMIRKRRTTPQASLSEAERDRARALLGPAKPFSQPHIPPESSSS